MSRKATPNIDYTSRDYEAYRNMMIAELKKKLPKYTDLSQSDAGIVILECLANGLDICSLYSDIIANDSILATTQDRATACVLADNLGYTPYNQTASITPQCFVLSSELPNDVNIPKGTKVATKIENGVQRVFETLEDLTIPAGNKGNEYTVTYDDAGNEVRNYKWTVDVINATSVGTDTLGSSDGNGNQKFSCNFPKVLEDTLEVYVSGDKWTKVDSFFDSDIDIDSEVYTVSYDEFDICYIEFGDGVHGKIPPNDLVNNIVAKYMTGGGASGNVKEESITIMKTNIPYVESTFNPYASTTLGRDKETLDEIRYNAPASFRVRDRAVTLQDYEDLIKINNDDFYGIYNTKAIRNADDNLQCDLYFQMREEIISVDGDDNTTVYTYPFDIELQDKLEDFFKDREMIGAHHTYNMASNYNVNFGLRLIVADDYYRDKVQKEVKEYIENIFFAFGEFTFGDDLVTTDLEAEILNNVAGVRSLRIETPSSDIISVENPYEIISLGDITFTLVSGGM